MLLFSCSSEFKPATFETVEINENFDADITVIYERAEGNNDLSQTINKNIEQAMIYEIGRDSTYTDVMSMLNSFNQEYVDFKKDFPDASEPKWELQIETERTYQSEDIITIAISIYQFQGGAHGNDQIRLLNLNAKNGAILRHEDFIGDIEGFEKLAKTYFLKNLENQRENLTMQDYFFGKPFHLPENIGYGDEGIILLYNVYEVASYAQGYTEFAIPYDIAESFLKMN
jgi:hypothetical protein